MTDIITLDALERFGMELGREAAPGSVIWLEGPLGAGKTTLARAIVRGRGVDDEATSPTYALVHHYHGMRGDVYHLDCYRLRDPDAASDLDWETLLGADLLLIEWPDRGGSWVPAATHRITLDHASGDARTLVLA